MLRRIFKGVHDGSKVIEAASVHVQIVHEPDKVYSVFLLKILTIEDSFDNVTIDESRFEQTGPVTLKDKASLLGLLPASEPVLLERDFQVGDVLTFLVRVRHELRVV